MKHSESNNEYTFKLKINTGKLIFCRSQ